MAVVAGTDGAITFSSGYATKITQWEVTAEAAILDATGMSDSWDRKLGGRKSWAGTITAKWDSTVQTDASLGSAPAAVTLRFSNEGTDGEITGNIIIQSIGFNVSQDDANSLSFSFVGDDAMAVREGIV